MKKHISIFMMSVTQIAPCSAKMLGVHGHLFDIEEPDLLQMIEGKLKEMKDNGKLGELQKDITTKMQERALAPRVVQGLQKTTKARTFYWNPTIIIPKDLKDQDGRVFWKAGQSFNPLMVKSLSKELLFIDGDDKAQETWAIERLKDKKGLIILVSGRPFDWMKRYNRAIYFDQDGRLVNKFNIKQVPAVISQEKDQFKIEELKLEETMK